MRTAKHALIAAICCLYALTGLAPATADGAKVDASTAKEVLDRTAKVYAGCTSYRDSGVVTTVFIEAAGNRTVEKPFTTAFVRPDRFRFEFRVTPDNAAEQRYVVWRDGDKVLTWWDVKPGVEKLKSLGLAIGGATGVSSGSASMAPHLLMPKELWGGLLTDTAAAKRLDDANLGKVECYCIEGKYGDAPRTVWIDKKTALVRRIDANTQFPTFRTAQTTTYDPVVNEAVPDKSLAFDPPKGK